MKLKKKKIFLKKKKIFLKKKKIFFFFVMDASLKITRS